MKWIGRAGLAMVALLLVVGVSACGSSDSDSTAASTGTSSSGETSSGENGSDAPSTAGLKVGVSNLGLSFPFTAGIARGIKAAADEMGIEITEVDAQGKADKQSTDVQDLIAGQPDGVLLIPVDGGVSVGQVEALKQAEVPVVAIASQVGDPEEIGPTEVFPDLAAWVAQDELEAGERAGEIALEEMPDGGVTAIVEGAAGFSSVRLRSEGFTKGLGAKADAFEVVANQPGDWLPEKAEAACQNMIEAHPEIELFYAESDDMAVGCAEAVKSAGSDAKIIGIGGSKLGLDAVRNGSVAGTVCYEPEDMGRQALEVLVEHIDGDAPPAQFVKAPAPGLTKENVGECDPQW